MDEDLRNYLLKHINLLLLHFNHNDINNLKLNINNNEIILKYKKDNIKINKNNSITKTDTRKRYFNPLTGKSVLCKKSINKQINNFMNADKLSELLNKF